MTDPEALRRIVAEGRQLADDCDTGVVNIYGADGQPGISMTLDTWLSVLSALECALSPQQARDAVLEEAAQIADRWSHHHRYASDEAIEHRAEQMSAAAAIAGGIRALKSAPPPEPKP